MFQSDEIQFVGSAGVGEDVNDISLSTLGDGNFVLAISDIDAGVGDDAIRLEILDASGVSLNSAIFDSVGDVIDISVAGLTGPAGNLAVAWAAGQMRKSFIGTTVLVEFETTGDNTADMAIEINLKKGAIDAADFIL